MIEVRPLEAGDADDVARLVEARRARGDVWEDLEPGAPAQVALLDGRVAGVGGIEWWDESDGTHLYLLLGYVHPDLRGHGVGRALLHYQEEWVRDHGAERGVVPTYGANADAERPRGQALLADHGYDVVFTVVELQRPLGDEPVPGAVAGIELTGMDEQHHPAVHALVEGAFGTSRLGAVPRDYDEYLREVEEELSGTDLWHLAWDADRLVGVVVNSLDGDVGETPWLAVEPAVRGRGIGELLMRASLASFARRGASRARLTTIAENPYSSVRLYERVGYQVTARWPRYRKASTSALTSG